MADSYVPYVPQNTGVATGQTISSANEKTDRAGVQASIDALNTAGQDTSNFKYSLQNQTYVRDFDITAVSTGANTVAISTNATTLYDYSSDTEQASWLSLASTNVSAITDGVIWAIYPGKTYTVTDDDPASRPANSYRVATFVNAAGTVTVTDNWQAPTESKENIFEEDNIFRKDVTVNGDVQVDGNFSTTGDLEGNLKSTVTEIDDTDSPYTVLTTDTYINADATSGAITINLYAASGNAGRRLTITKTDSSANLITLDGNGAETISGQTTVTLKSQYSSNSLYSDGSNWLIESSSLGALRFITSQTVSSPVTSIDFTDFIDDAKYDDYLFLCSNIKVATDGSDLDLLFSRDNGSNFDTGAADYFWALSNTYEDVSDAKIELAKTLGNTTEWEEFQAALYLKNPSNTSFTTKINGFVGYTSNSANIFGFTSYGGYRTQTAAVDSVRFIPDSDNITAGTIKLFGVKKA